MNKTSLSHTHTHIHTKSSLRQEFLPGRPPHKYIRPVPLAHERANDSQEAIAVSKILPTKAMRLTSRFQRGAGSSPSSSTDRKRKNRSGSPHQRKGAKRAENQTTRGAPSRAVSWPSRAQRDRSVAVQQSLKRGGCRAAVAAAVYEFEIKNKSKKRQDRRLALFFLLFFLRVLRYSTPILYSQSGHLPRVN